MTDMFEFTLNNPLTDEQWDMIADVDFDRTNRIWFHTKHGKEVEFAKVIRCRDCKHYKAFKYNLYKYCTEFGGLMDADEYCSRAEKKENAID